MKPRTRSVMIGIGLIAVVLLIAYAATAMGLPRFETEAFYTVRMDKPLSAFEAEKSAALLPYYGVVGEAPFAAFTDLQSTSLIPYFSVVGEEPFAPFTDLQSTSLIPYYSVLH